jgi:hypothetical protein
MPYKISSLQPTSEATLFYKVAKNKLQLQLEKKRKIDMN